MLILRYLKYLHVTLLFGVTQKYTGESSKVTKLILFPVKIDYVFYNIAKK